MNELGRQKWVLLETRKRDGSWIATPVSIVEDAGHLYFRAYDASGKAKRMRNFPDVRVAPSDIRGKARGPAHAGHIRLLADDESQLVRSLLTQKYPILQGWLVPTVHKWKGWTTLHYELTLDPT